MSSSKYLTVPDAVPRRGSRWFGAICRWVLRVWGWDFAGTIPDLSKFIAIAAPHTSNWDFPIAMLFIFGFRLEVSWMGKDSMFIFPFKWLLNWMNGIPIKRNATTGVVDQMVEWYDTSDKLLVVLAPEGTRSKVKKWKSGFYHIANGANVPVVMVSMNYTAKTIGFSEPFYPTGDWAGDLVEMQKFFAGIQGKRPDRQNVI